MSKIENLSRRQFLELAAGLAFSPLLPERFLVAGDWILKEHMLIAHSLYAKEIFALESKLVPFALAIATTETGFQFNDLGNWTFEGFTPKKTNKKEELTALSTIASWVGEENGINKLIVKYNQVSGKTVKRIKDLGCSEEGAFGRVQFLPSTWKDEVVRRKNQWALQEEERLIQGLKASGLVDSQKQSLHDFNPFVFSEALVMQLLYMQTCKMQENGEGFFGWNKNSLQAKLALERSVPIKRRLDKLSELKRMGGEKEEPF